MTEAFVYMTKHAESDKPKETGRRLTTWDVNHLNEGESFRSEFATVLDIAEAGRISLSNGQWRLDTCRTVPDYLVEVLLEWGLIERFGPGSRQAQLSRKGIDSLHRIRDILGCGE